MNSTICCRHKRIPFVFLHRFHDPKISANSAIETSYQTKHNTGDYQKLALTLQGYGVSTVIANVSIIHWLRNAAGLIDPNYWKGTLQSRPVVDWYLNRVDEAVNEALKQSQGSTMALSSLTFDSTEVGQGPGKPKDHPKETRTKTHQFQKPDSSNSSSVHPLRSIEDENLDYDSNASSSSFEFHKGEQRSHNNAISRSLLRPMSSKWNDAEKWIINRQNLHNHNSKNNQVNRAAVSSVKRVDFCQPGLQMGAEKFSFTHSESHKPVPGQASGLSESIDPCPESKDLKEVNTCGPSSNEDKPGCDEVRSVSMRDMGTEMTPIPSQEPSMTSTPVGATTPLRSPNYSIPSTPRRGPNSTPVDSRNPKELTEEEVKPRTRKEILQLGVQLGKMG